MKPQNRSGAIRIVIFSKPEAGSNLADRALADPEAWFASAGISGAALASACCVAPLLLLTAGVSGAWIGNLTAFAPYKSYFAAVAIISTGLGFWHIYFKAARACDDASYCARPQSRTITKFALWIATALILAALTVNAWAPWFY